MKQILRKLTLIMAAMFAVTTTSAYDFEFEGLCYNVLSLEDMTCQVVRNWSIYKGDVVDVVIPEEVSYNNRTFSVAAIGYEAFMGYFALESISIPNSVKSIGYHAFSGCSKLLKIDIPNSVTSIGDGAFKDCSSIESVTLPNSIGIINDYFFQGCDSLKKVIIPESVVYIGYEAFAYCSSLETISIPNSVTSIGDRAFVSCRSLKTVSIPNSVTSIGHNAFEECGDNMSVILSNNLEYIPDGLFAGCSMLSLEIPGSVNRICQYTASYENHGVSERENYTFSTLDKLQILYSPEILQVGYFVSSANEFITGSWACSSNPWGLDIKDLSINRKLEREMYIWHLEKLELGESIQEVQIGNLDSQGNLTTIESYGIVPPVLPKMSNSQYMNVNVFVPEEALDAYKADKEWGKFWNLQAAGVDGVKIYSKKDVIGRYDINGRAVSDDYQGLVIVRFSDGTCKKMLNRHD